MSRLKAFLSNVRYKIAWPYIKELYDQHDLLLRSELARAAATSKNKLNHYGAKYFSQTDEDGITLEIVRRLSLDCGTFAEFGVGDGLENNTLILLASGWKGFWVGGEDLSFDHTINPKRLAFFKSWVSLERLGELLDRGLRLFGPDIDVVSLDLDGNDYFFAEEILKKGVNPKLFIIEYNGKFPPPIRWTIKYNSTHTWDGSDYMGASLQLLTDLLDRHGYTLVCCNAATGSNAFFIRNDFAPLFEDVPKEISEIFVGCRYDLYKDWGHRRSPKTVEVLLESL